MHGAAANGPRRQGNRWDSRRLPTTFAKSFFGYAQPITAKRLAARRPMSRQGNREARVAASGP